MQSSTGLYDFANSEDILVGGAELGSQAGGQDGWFASEASTPDLWGSVVGTPAAADSPSVRTEAPATSVGRGDPPPAAPVEMAQVADKSCKTCRIRKVRCDRIFPACTRCRKRAETCEYGNGVPVTSRPLWTINSSTRMKPYDKAPASATADLVRPHKTSHPLRPHPSVPASSSSSYPYGNANSSLPPLSSAVSTLSKPWTQNASPLNYSFDIGPRGLDWQLAQPAMASSLTRHLLDASTLSCCFHLPAFNVFDERLPYLKKNLESLDLTNQVAVAILASLGARASPHSAVLGASGPEASTSRSQELVLSAGIRRESSWRAIMDRAVDLCSQYSVVQVPSRSNTEVLVALAQAVAFAEVRPHKARFFLRSAIGHYTDLLRSGLPPEELADIKRKIGPTLYESDARTAAYSNMPCLISEDDLHEYFEEPGVYVPILSQSNLSVALDNILRNGLGPITADKLDRALALARSYVCAVQRIYASIASDRRPSAFRDIEKLWLHVDHVHGAVQTLYRKLTDFNAQPAGVDPKLQHSHRLAFDLLIGVRLDIKLLDIINLSHDFLNEQRKKFLDVGQRIDLEGMIELSEKRVRKCLKLFAFYSKVFVDSLDQHMVFHLVVQLEVLPTWATMAVQRVGEREGPSSAEYELSEKEIDWFVEALELACFYTPLAPKRLDEIKQGRATRRQAAALALQAAPMPAWIQSFPTPQPPTVTPPSDLSALLSLPGTPSSPFTPLTFNAWGAPTRKLSLTPQIYPDSIPYFLETYATPMGGSLVPLSPNEITGQPAPGMESWLGLDMFDTSALLSVGGGADGAASPSHSLGPYDEGGRWDALAQW